MCTILNSHVIIVIVVLLGTAVMVILAILVFIGIVGRCPYTVPLFLSF